jgi:regulator of sirC expression with transglutaminase-like and TPR domain
MDDAEDGLQDFLELLEPEREPELDLAALMFARAVEYPALDVDAYLARLDGMAAELRPRISPEESPGRVVARINEYLFGEQGFRGNELDYYDPRNSYLNEVLDRRLGIPITLSIVYLAVARRLGIRLEGVSMPGHFLLRYPDPAESLLIDAFNRGAIISEEECRVRLRGTYGDALPLTPDMLRPVGFRAILFRMLGNLKAIYTRREEFDRAAHIVDLMRTIDQDAIDEYRDIGLLYFRMGRFKVARGELEFYLRKRPDAPDARLVREQLALISRLEVMRN